MTVFFTSDNHFYHSNVILYCKRPFSNADEMNEAMIKNWNSKIKPSDTTYHLGDFGFGSEDKLESILKRLNGSIHLVMGNHDSTIRKSKTLQNYFQSCSDLKEIHISGQRIVLCHYSMNVWNRSHYSSWQLFGHSHNSLPVNMNKKSMDVGVDGNNFYPWSFDEIKPIMDKRIHIPVDHHGKDYRDE